MPTYDYSCAACGHRSERFEGINDDGVKECPKCGKKKARRMLGMGAGLIFKGSGFYTTDSKHSVPSESGEDSNASGSGDSESGSKDSGKAKTDEPKGKKKKKEKEPKK